jgi:pyridinium-3,5-bisthiocarboxylic acid mononucleotide nickel chelatase
VKIAFFDAFSGVSGDMTVGAFLDLGVPLAAVEAGLAPLGLHSFHVELGRRTRSGIDAAKFTVHVDTDGLDPGHEGSSPAPGAVRAHDHLHEHGHPHPRDLPEPGGAVQAHAHHHAQGAHRPYRQIRDLLGRADLAPGVRDRAQRIFRALAVAEGRIHGLAADDVEFHEVGAIDAIVDIVSAAICLDYLGVERVYCSPLPLGSGFTRSQHGVIPVPPPATIELLRGFAVRTGDGECELVTPTGAAILAALATPGSPPPLLPVAIGYGAGDRELADRPNLLRVILAEPLPAPGGSAGWAPIGRRELGSLPEREEMIVLEANIDDMNPQLFEAAVESLFAAGARDVTLAAVAMKKGRPGTLLQVIAEPTDLDRLGALILRETSTIGVRSYPVVRLTLPRSRRSVATPHGSVDVKVVTLPDGSTRAAPEYEDCRRVARERGVPVGDVYAAALAAASTSAKP